MKYILCIFFLPMSLFASLRDPTLSEYENLKKIINDEIENNTQTMNGYVDGHMHINLQNDCSYCYIIGKRHMLFQMYNWVDHLYFNDPLQPEIKWP